MTAIGLAFLITIFCISQKKAPDKIESLAVLPFENLNRDSEQEYFSDGMTEALSAGTVDSALSPARR